MAVQRVVFVDFFEYSSVLDHVAERSVVVAAFASRPFAHHRTIPVEHLVVIRNAVDQMLTRYVHFQTLVDGVGSE